MTIIRELSEKDSNTSDEEDYVICPGCGRAVEKYYSFCPYCGRKIKTYVSPSLLTAAGLYFLNTVLLGILFAPYFLITAMFELGTSIFLIGGYKRGGYLGLMLSTLVPIFLIICLLQQMLTNIAVPITLIVSHIAGACLIIHEWDSLT